MNRFEEILDEICKYGISKVSIKNAEIDLEKWLVLLYGEYVEIQYEVDEKEYPNFDKSTLPKITEIVELNFPNFGYYNSISDVNLDYQNPAEIFTGDANDDLSDIIIDLMEVKWRLKNTSENDAKRFFKSIFEFHTQQHLIDLLNFIKNKED